MDYLFGIVVLLCGVVQAGRGAKPKHNVPRLKLSYKGKPPYPSQPHTHPPTAPGAAEQRCSPVQPVSRLRLLFSTLLFRALFLLLDCLCFFLLFFSCESLPARVSSSLLHLGQ